MTKKIKEFVPSDGYMEYDIHDSIADVNVTDTLSYIPAHVVEDIDFSSPAESLQTWCRRSSMVHLVEDTLAMFSATDAGSRWLSTEGWNFWRVSPRTRGLLRTVSAVHAMTPEVREEWSIQLRCAHSVDHVALRDWRCALNMAALWYLSRDPTKVLKIAAYTLAEAAPEGTPERATLERTIKEVTHVMKVEEEADWLIESYLLLSTIAPIEVLVRHRGMYD
jgi:hypothetical protein